MSDLLRTLKKALGFDEGASTEDPEAETTGAKTPKTSPEEELASWARPPPVTPAGIVTSPKPRPVHPTAQMPPPRGQTSPIGSAPQPSRVDSSVAQKSPAGSPPQTAQVGSPIAPTAHLASPAGQIPQIATPPPPAPRIGGMLTDWESPLRQSSSQYPALAADGGTRGALEVFAAASAGLAHLQDGMGCQDAFALRPSPHGLIVSIADGVSNAPLGAAGARTSTQAAVAAGGTDTGPATLALELALWSADESVSREAADRGADPRSLATTLIVALVAQTHVGMHVNVISIGDSSAFVMRSPSDMTRLVGPEEMGSTVLRTSLPMNTLMQPERAETTLKAGELLVLVTDGLAADLISSPGVRAWCWERWTSAESPLQAAAALGYRRQGTSDDLAAVVVRRRR